MAKKGRPNAWIERIEPRKDEIVEWVRAGATNKEVAEALGVGYATFMDHVSKNPDFSDSLKQARLSGVPMVKLALMKRALGFEYEEVKTSIKKDDDGEVKQFIEKVKKYCPPDVGACQTFLRNNTDDFRDKAKFDYDFKTMEIELKKLQVESQNF
ncbi:MAG: hypothetical protein IKY66_05475 [Bacteroidales bacterium]|nr:hypothetical protein [Bacteroidales bacterium]